MWGLVIWILLQPNLSNVIVAMFIWASMVWMNKVPLRQILAGSPSAALLIVVHRVPVPGAVPAGTGDQLRAARPGGAEPARPTTCCRR